MQLGLSGSLVPQKETGGEGGERERGERGKGGGEERIRGGERKRREEERERRGEGEQSGGERTEDYNLHFILLLLIISPLSNFKT